MNTFWSDLGVIGGNTSATNQYEVFNGLTFSGGFTCGSMFDFFKHLITDRFNFFKSYNSVDSNIIDETTFYKNTSDPDIYDFYTFYQNSAKYISPSVTPTPTPTPTNTPTQTPTPTPTPTPSATPAYGPGLFVFDVDTTKAGSPSTDFNLPLSNTSVYNFNVNWGDGTTQTVTGSPSNVLHSYAVGGTYQITISGTFPRIFFNDPFFSNDRLKLIKIKQWGNINWTSMSFAFAGCANMDVTATDIPILSGVTNAERMFKECSSLSGNSSFNSWNTSSFTLTREMFWGTQFNYSINNWNMSGVTDISGMFLASSYNQPLSGWNVSNITNMASAFQQSSFNQNINNWNVSNVNTMSGLFAQCPFNQPLNSWNVSGVTQMTNMFNQNITFNQDITGWNVSNVDSMGSMFYSATSFNQNISIWNVIKVNSFYQMFQNATSFNQNLGAWSLRLVGFTTSMLDMFNNCGLSTENYSRTLIGWANYVFANGGSPSPRTLGALNMTYNNTNYTVGLTYNNAVTARNYLTTGRGWTISGDTQV
jgi:hypothetical protein